MQKRATKASQIEASRISSITQGNTVHLGIGICTNTFRLAIESAAGFDDIFSCGNPFTSLVCTIPSHFNVTFLVSFQRKLFDNLALFIFDGNFDIRVFIGSANSYYTGKSPSLSK